MLRMVLLEMLALEMLALESLLLKMLTMVLCEGTGLRELELLRALVAREVRTLLLYVARLGRLVGSSVSGGEWSPPRGRLTPTRPAPVRLLGLPWRMLRRSWGWCMGATPTAPRCMVSALG